MHRWKLILLVVSCFSMRSCYLEQVVEEVDELEENGLVVELDHVEAFTDRAANMLLYMLPSDTLLSFSPYVRLGEFQSVILDGKELKPDQINDLGEVTVNHPYSVIARNSSGTHTFQLYFTTLPLIRITTDQEIPDEPKTLSRATIQYARNESGNWKTVSFSTYAGIEIRGRSSALLEKKSYGLELWKDTGRKDYSARLLGMRNGEDWILDAMYIDPLRMRNKLAFELWEKMWRNSSGSPWKTSNPGIRCEYAELFINQRYMGLYCLTEKLDDVLINLSGQSGTKGVMYKAVSWIGGATGFKTYNSEPEASWTWEGWEQISPDNEYCWEPLSILSKMVVMEEDEIFKEKIGSLVDLDCLAEYYLFINLILAHDNIIKNYYLARYADTSRFLILPWDLEASAGIMWDGERNSSNGLLENNLYKRLMELDVGDFRELIESKWDTYRCSTFRLDSLMASPIFYTDQLKRSGVIERENNRWNDAGIDIESELEYMMEWTTLRLEYLDHVFEQNTEEE